MTDHTEATKKRLQEEAEAREKLRAARDATAVKPTPTQAENDLAASGVPVPEHEPDGSPTESGMQDKSTHTRHAEAKPAASQRGSYATRASTSE